jgi:hypothetical protein
VEQALTDVRRRRDEAEAEAGRAAEALARLASGMTPLAEVDTDRVRAAADTFADATGRLKALDELARILRGLLM